MAIVIVVPMSGWSITSAAEEAEHQPDRPQHRPPVADVGRPPGEEVGAVEQQGELGQLRRLEAHRPDAEPPGRPVDVDADAGDQHEQQQAGRDDQRRADVAAKRPVVDAGGDGQAEKPERRPGELTLEEQPRRPVVGQRLDRRRRQHHDEADEVEDDDRRQQGVVAGRAEAAAVAPGLPGPADGAPDLRLPGLAPFLPGRRRGCGLRLDHPPAGPVAAAAAFFEARAGGTGPGGRSARTGQPPGLATVVRCSSGGVTSVTSRRAATSRAKSSPAGGVAAVPVERGAGRREEDGVAGLGQLGSEADGLGHRPGPTDGADAGEAGLDLAGRLADGHHRPDPAGLLTEHAEVQALVAATGQQHHRVETGQGGQGGVGVGRLRVVDEGHPPTLAYRGHSVGEPRECGQYCSSERRRRSRDRRRRPPPPGRWRCRGARGRARSPAAMKRGPVRPDEDVPFHVPRPLGAGPRALFPQILCTSRSGSDREGHGTGRGRSPPPRPRRRRRR